MVKKYKFACQHCTGEGTVGETVNISEEPVCQKCSRPMKCLNCDHDNDNAIKRKSLELGRRRVQKIKKSSYVNLPKTWVTDNDVREGDLVEFIMDKNGILLIRKAPPAAAKEASAQQC